MLNLRKLLARTGILALAAGGAACTSVSFFIANVPASFGPYHRTADVAYGSDKRQRLDVYVPSDGVAAEPVDATSLNAGAGQSAASGQSAGSGQSTGSGRSVVSGHAGAGRPVVIFWYGGSWTTGSKGSYKFVGAALAERGFVTVLPDYRLYPKVKFPVFLEDAALAVAWVQQHAHEFGGDPRRVVLMGHSAGAHIAAFMALRPDFLAKAGAKPEWIAGLVGLAGPYALAPNTRTLHTIFGKPFAEADWQPVRFVTHQAPPAFLAHGLDDYLVSPRQTEQLRDALRRNDVRVETELYPDRGHADMIAGFSVPARHRVPVLDEVVKFIDSVTSGAAVAGAAAAVPDSARLAGAQ